MILAELSHALKSFYDSKPNMTVPSFSGDGMSEVQPISEAYINLTLLNFSEISQTAVGEISGSLAEAEEEVDASLRRRQPVELGALLNQRNRNGQRARRILVTGRAGIGKSTLCHRIAYEWSQARLWAEVPAVVWLSLKTIQKYVHKPELSLAEWLYFEYFQNTTVSLDTVQQWIVSDKSAECLFLLDGFDEVAHLLERSNALRAALALSFVMVTTRPYARPDRDANIQFDLQVENIGFKNSDVTSYLQHRFRYEPEKGKALDTYLNRNFNIRTACYIPLNLFLLTSLWEQKRNRSQKGQEQVGLVDGLSFTGFYNEFLKAFLHNYSLKSNRFNADDKLKAKDWTLRQLEERLESELGALDEIAFTQLRETQQLIISLEKINTIMQKIDSALTIGMLRETGFLKPATLNTQDHSVSYYFVHFTFQEFFAARYVARQIKERDEGMLHFIAEHKYHPRYTVMMQFLAGLILRDNNANDKVKRYLWDALLSHEMDLVGLRHCEFIIPALEESCALEEPRKAGFSDELLKKIQDDIWRWIVFSYTQNQADEASSTKRLREKTRENLSRVLALSPHVAQVFLERFQHQWSTLDPHPKTLILKYYVTEWVNSLPEASTFLLEALNDVQLTPAQREVLFQDVPWERLKETPVKYDLRERLLTLLRSLIEPLHDENLNLLGLTLDAFSLLIDEEEPDETFKATVTELLHTLSQQLHTEPIAHLKLNLTMLQDRLNHQAEAIPHFEAFLRYPENNITQAQFEYVIRHADMMVKHYPGYKQTLMEILRDKLQQCAAENNPLAKTIAAVLKQLGDTSPDILQYAWERTGREGRSQISDLMEEKIQTLQALVLKTNITVIDTTKIEALIKGIVTLIEAMPNVLVSDFVAALLKAVAEGQSTSVRQDAIEALGKAARRAPLDLLLSVMDILLKAAEEDQDAEVRRVAIKALSNTVERMSLDLLPSVINALLKAVAEGQSTSVRQDAIEALGKAARRAPLDLLLSVMDILLKAAEEDQDAEVRRVAIKALSNTVERMSLDLLPSVINALLKAVAEGQDAWVRSAAIKALGNTVERMSVDLLPSEINALLKVAAESQDAGAREAAIKVLGNTAERTLPDLLPNVVDVLLKVVIENQDEWARIAAIEALGNAVGRMSVDLLPGTMDVLLKTMAEDQDAGARKVAIKVLGNTAERTLPDLLPNVVDVLLKVVIENQDEWARIAAIEALGNAVERMSVDLLPGTMDVLLKTMAEDKYKEARRVAIEALGKAVERMSVDLLSSAINALLKAAAEDKYKEARRVAIEALGKAVERMSVDLLSSAINALLKAAAEDKYKEARRVAIEALGNAVEQMSVDLLPSAINALLKVMIEDQDAGVCDAAIGALSNVIERTPVDLLPSVINALLKTMAEDQDAEVRSATIWALGNAVERTSLDLLPNVVDVLLKVVTEEKHVVVRKTAIGALSNVIERTPADLLPSAINALLKTMAEDQDAEVRSAAIWVLGNVIERTPADLLPSAINALLKTMAEDQDAEVRSAAIWVLGNAVERTLPDLLLSVMDVLLKVVAKGQDEKIRRIVIQALGNVVRRTPLKLLSSVMNMLLKAAIEGQNKWTRHVAIEVLSNVVKWAPPDLLSSVMDILLKAAAEDKNKDSRKIAIQALAQAQMEEYSLDAYETLLRFAKDSTDIAVSMMAIQCLSKIKKIKSDELNKHTLKLLLSELLNHNDVTVRSARKQLQVFKTNPATSAIFMKFLLGLLWEGSHYQKQISDLLFYLNVNFEELYYAYQTFFQNPETSQPKLLKERLDYFILPLVEQLMCEGFTLKGYKNKPGLYVTLYDGKTVEVLDERFAAIILQTILRLTKQQLKSLHLKTQPHRELMKSAVPRYRQRSSISFFHEPRLQTWQQSFPLIPAITQNQTIATRQSEMLHPHLIPRHAWQYKFIQHQQELLFKLFISFERNAIKIEPINNQKLSAAILENAIANHVLATNTYLDLSDCQLTDESISVLARCQAQLKHLSILKLSHNCFTQNGLTALLELSQQLKHLHYVFFDHNHIVFDDVYCEGTLQGLLEKTHLVHLDVSMNFIQNGRLLEDTNNHRTLSDEECQDQIHLDRFFFCRKFITDSLIIHSSYHRTRVKSILNPEKEISAEKGVVVLMAYKNNGINPFEEHALLAIETLEPEFGQRILMMADLVNPDENRISVRLYRILPEDFLRNYSNRTHERSANIEHGLIGRLVEKILESKDRQDFYDYELMADPDKQGAYNCLKWAYEQLRVIGIAKKQEHWLPSWDVKRKQTCMIS